MILFNSIPHFSLFSFWTETGLNKAVFVDGSTYAGEYMNNQKHGLGVYRFADESSYSGQWQHNKMHGRGVAIRADRSARYEGTFENGRTATGSWKLMPLDAAVSRTDVA
jgi:hypothetical protein